MSVCIFTLSLSIYTRINMYICMYPFRALADKEPAAPLGPLMLPGPANWTRNRGPRSMDLVLTVVRMVAATTPGSFFVGVLQTRALLSGVYIRAPDFLETPMLI